MNTTHEMRNAMVVGCDYILRAVCIACQKIQGHYGNKLLFVLQLLSVLLICDTSIMSSFPLVCMLFLSYLFTYTYSHIK